MKALIYLFIVVVGLALAAGFMACKREGGPGVTEVPLGEELAPTAAPQPPDYYCDECVPVPPTAWYEVEDYPEYQEHMEEVHEKTLFCDEEVTKPSGDPGDCGKAFWNQAELDDHQINTPH